MRPCRFDYRLVTGFKPRLWIRNAAPLLFVDKVESQNIASARRQTRGHHDHETAELIRAGAVTEHQRDTRPFSFRRRIQKRRDTVAVVDSDSQHFRIHIRCPSYSARQTLDNIQGAARLSIAR